MTVPGNFEFHDAEAEERINEIGKLLRASCPPGMGFVFLIAHLGQEGGLFYTSNVDRRDVCNLMREFIERHEKQ